jgi:hypothetical protein
VDEGHLSSWLSRSYYHSGGLHEGVESKQITMGYNPNVVKRSIGMSYSLN